jgi:hypothetical protein
MKISRIVLTFVFAISFSYANIILLPGFPYSGSSGDGDINTYGIVNILTVNGIDNVTQIEKETWHARNGESWMIEEIAGNSSINIFGYYDLDDSNIGYEVFKGQINDGKTGGPDSNTNPPLSQPGIPITFGDKPTNFGFYVASNGSYTNLLFSEVDSNPGARPQVAVFQYDNDPHSFILAWEDYWLATGSDADYNDMVVKVTLSNAHSPDDDAYLANRIPHQFFSSSLPPVQPPSQVPEPSTILLVITGFLFIIVLYSFTIRVKAAEA